MQTAHHAALLSAVPVQDLLLMAVAFTLAALILLVLSIEAGNYPKISAGLRQIQHALHRRLHRHCSGENYSGARRVSGH